MAWHKGVAVLGEQPLTVPGRVMGLLVCYLLPIVAVMLYEGWLLRQFDANQRLRAGSSRVSSSATAQNEAGVQQMDRPALHAQRASSSMGDGSKEEGHCPPPGATTTNDIGGHQQGDLVQAALDLPAVNLGAPVNGGGSVLSLATEAASGGQPAAGRQFVYKRPKGCLQLVTIAVKVMYALTI